MNENEQNNLAMQFQNPPPCNHKWIELESVFSFGKYEGVDGKSVYGTTGKMVTSIFCAECKAVMETRAAKTVMR